MGSYNSTKKSDKGMLAITITMIVIAVLVVALLAGIVINKTGIVNRTTVVAASDNAKIDRAMLAYYEYELMMNDWQNNYYQYLYCYYGMYEDTYGILKTFDSPDAFAFNMAIGYRDAYEVTSVQNARTLLALYEEACANNTELTDDDMEDINSAIEAIGEKTASAGPAVYLNLSSAAEVVSKLTGCNVNNDDILRALKFETIASKYLEKHTDGVVETHRSNYLQNNEAFKKYAEEHKDQTYVITYDNVVFKASDKATAEAAKNAKTIKELKEAVYKYVMDNKFSEQYKTEFGKIEGLPEGITEDAIKTAVDTALRFELLSDKEEETGESETTAIEEATTVAENSFDTARKNLTEAMKKLINKEFDNITENKDQKINYIDSESDSYSSLTEEEKWLVSADRKAGDAKYFTGEPASSTDASVTSKLYEIKETAHLDDEITRGYGYVKVAFDKDASESTDDKLTKDDARVIANKLLANVKGLDDIAKEFSTVCEDEALSKYTPNYSDKVSEDGTPEDEIGEWLFKAKVGDSDIIEVEGAFYVVALGKINEMNWAEVAISGLASEELAEWNEACIDKYHVTVKSSFQKKVDKYNKELEESAVTTVAEESATTAAN